MFTLKDCSRVSFPSLETNSYFSKTGELLCFLLDIELAFNPLISIPPHLKIENENIQKMEVLNHISWCSNIQSKLSKSSHLITSASLDIKTGNTGFSPKLSTYSRWRFGSMIRLSIPVGTYKSLVSS